MNATDIHGYWETPSPNVPKTMEYMRLSPDGRMLSLGRQPLGFFPPDSWFTLWYSYRLTENGELVIRPLGKAAPEQTFTIERASSDTLFLHRTIPSPHDWFFTRVSWANPPDYLAEAHRKVRGDSSASFEG